MTKSNIAVSKRPATRTATKSEAEQASGGTIRLNTFRSARDKVPTARDLDWGAACREIKKLITATTAQRPRSEAERKRFKTDLPAFNTATLTEAYNDNSNVQHLTALPIDVDSGDLIATHARAEAAGIDALIYTSPSHPNADHTDRFRVIVPLDAPLAPGDVKHARKALAEMLGIGPGQGVERADAVSQVFFCGQFKGDNPRECFEIEGEPVSTAALVSAVLARPWSTPAAAKSVKALDRLGIEDADDRTVALLDALAEHWEAPGEATGRRQVLRAFGGYLARRGWTDEQIAAVGRGLETDRPEADRLALMVECARSTRDSDGETGAGWSGLVEWNPDAAALIESVAKDPTEPAGWPGVWDDWWRRQFAREGSWVNRGKAKARPKADALAKAGTPGTEAKPGGDFAGPYILQSATHAETILLWHGPDYGHQPVAVGSLRLVIKTLGIDNEVPLFEDVELKNGETKTVKLPAQVIIERHAKPFSQTIYDFAKRVSEYEPDRARVVVGYPDVNVVGVFDHDVEAWLKVLAGDAYSRLEAWIASCAQEHIERLAAALVLTGPADLGKSLLSCAVAGLWGALTPPRAELLIKQFNGELKNCPVVCDEEAQLFGSRQLSTKRFRDLTQSTERSIELKGLETFTLRGALRLIVPCNEISDLHFTDLGGPDILNAVSDRLCVIDAKPRAAECKEALARLRVPGGWVCNRERVTAHMAWICESVTLPKERFIGSGGADSTAAVLAGHVEENTELWDTFREWVDGDRVVNLWSVHGGRLCADPKQLATTLEHRGKGWDALRVKRALEPFKVRDYRPDGDERPRLWELAAERVTAALQLEAETRAKLDAIATQS
ncbi:MAG TPA: primase-helicase family protein, partial [Polyangiaceae bacterium]|nr:primase-helicase family protein [Polyangiaceae bacterium]